HQLHLSDDVPGIYFFRSSTNKTWDETPFAFDDAVKKVFAHVEDLPATRQKEKVGKYELPRANTQKGNPARSEKQNERKDRSAEPSRVAIKEEASQPDYGLRHKINVAGLDRIVYSADKVSRRQVLDYYSNIAAQILPYLKDRYVSLRFQGNSRRKDE